MALSKPVHPPTTKDLRFMGTASKVRTHSHPQLAQTLSAGHAQPKERERERDQFALCELECSHGNAASPSHVEVLTLAPSPIFLSLSPSHTRQDAQKSACLSTTSAVFTYWPRPAKNLQGAMHAARSACIADTWDQQGKKGAHLLASRVARHHSNFLVSHLALARACGTH